MNAVAQETGSELLNISPNKVQELRGILPILEESRKIVLGILSSQVDRQFSDEAKEYFLQNIFNSFYFERTRKEVYKILTWNPVLGCLEIIISLINDINSQWTFDESLESWFIDKETLNFLLSINTEELKELLRKNLDNLKLDDTQKLIAVEFLKDYESKKAIALHAASGKLTDFSDIESLRWMEFKRKPMRWPAPKTVYSKVEQRVHLEFQEADIEASKNTYDKYFRY